MKDTLKKELIELDEVGFGELVLHIETANRTFSFLKQSGLSVEEFARRMKITPEEGEAFRFGAYPYTLMDLATLETVIDTRVKELKEQQRSGSSIITKP